LKYNIGNNQLISNSTNAPIRFVFFFYFKVERAVKDKKELKGDLNSIWNLTAIGYGGTKPQNISVLNKCSQSQDLSHKTFEYEFSTQTHNTTNENTIK
jgi:hypothetical protein